MMEVALYKFIIITNLVLSREVLTPYPLHRWCAVCIWKKLAEFLKEVFLILEECSNLLVDLNGGSWISFILLRGLSAIRFSL